MSIDKYDPIRVIGEGSFGKVYLMRDKVRKNFVCVKIIKIKNIPKKEREATKVEVDLLRKLHHPNIVRYIDSFLSKNNESLCICMEYCDGGDLASQIKAAKRNLFSESKILNWFVQLCLGLHYMHSAKVLHRDLKTQNVFLLGNGRLVLGDLGISKVLDGTMDFAQTCIGTPYYMSPEIFQNKPYSYKSDVWALGCVLYEMTTLNHAFDANSINGLAGKIVKGRYPPIHHKYSRYLRDLIGEMLQINPAQRPDLDQILRKPFIKKHTINFFMDMNARPQASIGEGTMIVRQASGGGLSGNDANMLGLRKQLQQLDMTGALAKAQEPKEPINDVVSAQKIVKEQVGALKREEEHKRLVEAALEKMRQERANRVKHRSQAGARVPDSGPYGNRGRDRFLNKKNDEPNKPAALRNRGPSQSELRGVPSNEALRKEQRDRNSVGSKPSAPEPVSARRRSFGEDQDRLKERERRVAEEKKRIQVQESRDRADEKRREDVRIEARAREEARIEDEKRNREDMVAKQKMELLKAQADSAARRDKQRETERIRQQDEIEQLKRDKIELDRRTNEREKLREQRKLEEQAKLNEVRREKMDLVQEKLDNMNDQIKNIPNPRIFRSLPEEKDSDNLNARERVIFRKQEKLAKEEETRIEELRKAENDNRKIRENAQFKNRAQYRSGDLPLDEESKYEFDAGKGRPTKNRQENMNVNELSDRLFEATKGLGKPNRFETDSEPPTDRESARSRDTSVDNSNKSIGKRIENELFSSDSSGGEDDESVNWDNQSNNDGTEEDEIMNRREQELQAELQMSTLRCDALKRTLIETKSFIDPKLLSSKKPASSIANKIPQGGPVPSYDNLDEVSSDEDDEFEEYEDSNDYDDEPVVVVKSSNNSGRREEKEDPNVTPRKQKSLNVAVKESPYYNLQDPPTPTGRLSDRIERLRQRCIEALGADAFFDAYRFLKEYDEQYNPSIYEEEKEEEKMSKMRAILGDNKFHYTSLIEQLLFMEETVV